MILCWRECSGAALPGGWICAKTSMTLYFKVMGKNAGKALKEFSAVSAVVVK